MAQPKLPPNYQWWKGSIRVRVWVPEECRARIGKSELVKALETTNPRNGHGSRHGSGCRV